MDKIRDFLRTLRRLHFWILIVCVLLLGVTFWLLSISKLDREKQTRQTSIKSTYTDLIDVERIPQHPNQLIHDAMDQLILETRDEIRDAWTEKWDQQQTDILTWPGERNERLTRGSEEAEKKFKAEWNRSFVSKVKPLRPIEKEVSFPMTKQEEHLLILKHREFYKGHIHKQLVALAKMIGSKWRVAAEAGGHPGVGAGPFGGGGYESMGYGQGGIGTQLAYQTVVQWDQQNQSELQQQHFDWSQNAQMAMGNRGSAGSSLDKVPNTLEILYAQEDMWVLRALMAIIERTNDGAQSRHNAAIKRIEFIKIGKAAIHSLGEVETVQSAKEDETPGGSGGMTNFGSVSGFKGMPGTGGADGGAAGSMRPEADGYSGMDGFGRGAAGEDGEMALPDPAEGRYVDKNYEPLPAETLRSVMTAADKVEPENAYLAVAKRVPVRMRFSMDQTKIENLLVECANAALTVEVRQVRINPKDTRTFGGAYGTGGMFGEMGPESAMMPSAAGLGGGGRFDDEEGGAFGEFSGGEFSGGEFSGGEFSGGEFSGGGFSGGRFSGGGRGGGGTARVNPAMLYPFDITVEIYGIVYIYSPVDNTILGYEREGEEGEAATSDLAHRDVGVESK